MSKKTWRAIDGNPNNTGFRIFEGDQYIGFIGDSDEKTDAKANAQLIAAAPELLEVLTQCRAELLAMIDKHNQQDTNDGSWLYDYQTVVEADKAIKKARGEL